MSDIPLSIFNRQHCMQYHKLIVRLRQHSKNKTRHLHTHSETTMLLMLQNGYRKRCVRFGLSKEWHAKAAFLWQVNRRAKSFSHGCKNWRSNENGTHSTPVPQYEQRALLVKNIWQSITCHNQSLCVSKFPKDYNAKVSTCIPLRPTITTRSH